MVNLFDNNDGKIYWPSLCGSDDDVGVFWVSDSHCAILKSFILLTKCEMTPELHFEFS